MKLPGRSKTIMGLTSFVLFGSLVVSLRAQQTMTGTVRVDIEGADPQSAAIRDAHISLYSPDRILRTTSDAAGHFQFDRIPFGVYELEVARLPYKTKTVDNVRVTGFTRSEDLQFSIGLVFGDLNAECGRRDSVLYGPATGPEGNSIIGTVLVVKPLVRKSPVANARVALLSDQGVKLGEEITNERGEFAFKPNVPGRYLIEMSHPAFNLLKSTVFWTARENRTSLILDPVPVGKMIVCQ